MNKSIDFSEHEIEQLKYHLAKKADSLQWVLDNKDIEEKKREWMKKNIVELRSLYKRIVL